MGLFTDNQTPGLNSRLQMILKDGPEVSPEDSRQLIDSQAAGKLGHYHALWLNEHENKLTKFKTYEVPSKNRLGHIISARQIG